jgi:endonuclease YncB( thermonuclease family)
VKNYDGDTITFDIPGVPPIIGNDMVIRVRGIDTPELKRNTCRAEIVKGRQAKKLVRSLLRRAKIINLHRVGRGKYFRFVADVEVDGKNLADILIKNGLAVPYDGGKKKHDWCAGSIFDGLFSAMGLPPP